MQWRDLKGQDIGALLLVAVILALGIIMTVAGGSTRGAQAAATSESAKSDTQIARGKYIVEDVAMCGMCHTPRTDSGEVDTGRKLDGAPIWLMPAHPMSDWPPKAPRIAGTLPASDDDMVRLLTTGIWIDGSHLRAPMPQFRMSREDAESVVAYLRSLRPSPGD